MERPRILREGLLVGLAGATAVALWFFVYDLAEGMPFRTPALLGAALLHGLRDPADLIISSRLVLEYSAVHAVLFVLFGWAIAGLFALADRDHHVLFAAFMLFMCFEVAALAATTVLASWLFHTLEPWAIVGANLIATTAMLSLLFHHHRRASGDVLTSAE